MGAVLIYKWIWGHGYISEGDGMKAAGVGKTCSDPVAKKITKWLVSG